MGLILCYCEHSLGVALRRSRSETFQNNEYNNSSSVFRGHCQPTAEFSTDGRKEIMYRPKLLRDLYTKIVTRLSSF